MKKVPVTDENDETANAPTGAPDANNPYNDDPIAALQADLDRFRDLALRGQADFENYKKRCAREK